MTKTNGIKFSKQTVILFALILIALLSIFVVAKIVSTPRFYQATLNSLENKKITVMNLAAATAASSTALSFIPGDAAMPIANQIAQLSSYFIIILCAILLEKMLITVVGYVSFTFIIPFACGLYAFYLYIKKDILKSLAIKLAILGVVLFAAIPVSIQVSDLVYSSYQASVEQALETVTQNKEYIDEQKEMLSKEDQNWIGKIGSYLSDFTSKIGSGMSQIIKKGEETLGTFLDAVAVLIVTSCVIPIVVILLFAWVIKILFGFNVKGITRKSYEVGSVELSE